MPIDIGSYFDRAAARLAGGSVVGSALGNPLWFGLILVAVMLLILYFVSDITPDARLGLYMFGSAIILVLAHDTMVANQLRERYKVQEADSIVGAVTDQPVAVAPRDPAAAVASYAKTQFPVDNVPDASGGGYMDSSPYEVSYEVPQTADQLLAVL